MTILIYSHYFICQSSFIIMVCSGGTCMHLRTGNASQPCSFMCSLSSNAANWRGLRLRCFLSHQALVSPGGQMSLVSLKYILIFIKLSFWSWKSLKKTPVLVLVTFCPTERCSIPHKFSESTIDCLVSWKNAQPSRWYSCTAEMAEWLKEQTKECHAQN